MVLEKIRLKNFRNFKEREFSFKAGKNLVVGPNTTGKTNLLEAIYLFSSGQSFRATRIEEMVRFGQEVAHLEAQIDGEEKKRLQIVLTNGQVGGQKTALSRWLVNGVVKTKGNFLGNFLAVIFRPEDLEILVDSPAVRRYFLDEVLSSADIEYYRSLSSYERGLRSRNKILEQIREGKTTTKSLFFYDRLLIENGEKITQKREEFLDFLNQRKCWWSKMKVVYEKNVILPARLEEKQEIEILLGKTLVGPHRDNFLVFDGNRDLSTFGSRGEQRMGVLWLKLGQLAFWEKVKGEKAVLLLDDIFSELDENFQKLVVEELSGNQVIVTSVEERKDWGKEVIRL
ncbi:DNA replication and repair protein RecF [Candidatus Shapirobacteria bacterium]|nr:DNA replication and repair protein RecF [Candidatus Shapirobacteria bacterium]